MDLNCWIHFGCSTDCDHVISAGQRYGGLGWICKRITSVSYKAVEGDSNLVSGLQVIQNGCVKLNIIGVYLPHYCTWGLLRKSQSMGNPQKYYKGFQIDHVGEPVIIVGNINASVPNCESVRSKWIRSHPFTKIAYFYTSWLIIVCNFSFKQSVKYIYSKGKHRSFIDHMLVPKYRCPQ